jgi:hypothetical protein
VEGSSLWTNSSGVSEATPRVGEGADCVEAWSLGSAGSMKAILHPRVRATWLGSVEVLDHRLRSDKKPNEPTTTVRLLFFASKSLATRSRLINGPPESDSLPRPDRSTLGDYPGPIWPPIRRRVLSKRLKARRACLTALTIGTVPVRAAIVGVPPTGGRRRRGGRGPND